MQATAQGHEQTRVLIAGYGDLGSAIGQRLAKEGLTVFGLRRSKHLHSSDILMLNGDVTQPDTLKGLEEIDPQILVYCIAATEQSDDNYRAHYVDGLRHVLAALAPARHLRHVFFVSSSRVYGQTDDRLLDESDPALPSDFGGQRLLEAEQLLASLPCGHTALRLSGIYGPERTRMLSLARDPARWPPQNSWSNRIHRDDAAAFAVHLIHRVLGGASVADCYIVTDSSPAPLHETLRWLAERMGHTAGQIASPAPLGGKRLSNARMLETGFRLRYPDYRAGYAALLEQARQ